MGFRCVFVFGFMIVVSIAEPSKVAELEGMGRRVVAKWMRASMFPWAAIGFMGFSAWGNDPYFILKLFILQTRDFFFFKPQKWWG